MKVFVSSTRLDLKEHRRETIDALGRLDLQSIGMEYFGARPEEPLKACLSEIDECDLFIGIYAHRYGSNSKGFNISITEEEFNYARIKHKPVFCFLVNKDYNWPEEFIEGEPGKSKLGNFKSVIEREVVRESFTTPENLAKMVATSLGRYLSKNNSGNPSLINLPTIQEVLYKKNSNEGRFFRKEPFWIDLEQGFIIKRVEVAEIIKRMDCHKIQLILGDAASGKSIILKNIGFDLSLKMNVYYIDLKRYYSDEIDSLFNDVIRFEHPSLFIVDDAHLYIPECKKLIRKFNKKEKGWLIIGSRNSLCDNDHPKEFSEFENIEKKKIFAEDIAGKVVSTFLSKKYEFGEEQIRIISNNLAEYKKDLWVLSWALLSYNPSKNSVAKHEISDKIAESITNQGRQGKKFNAQEIFLPISIFYRFEIPIEEIFLESIGINKEEIRELISLNEIIEDRKNGTVSLAHSSIADLYFETYEERRGLGGKIRNRYRNNISYQLFYDYLLSEPSNFIKIFIALRRDINNEKDGLSLIKELINNPPIQNIFIKNINLEPNIVEASFSITSVAAVDNDIAFKILEKIDLGKMAQKFDSEVRMERIPLFLLNIIRINGNFIHGLFKLIDIKYMIEKLKNESMHTIIIYLATFDRVNSNISKEIVEALWDEDKIRDFLNENNDILSKSSCILYMAKSNHDMSIKLLGSLDINELIHDIKTEADFLHLFIYLYAVDVFMYDLSSEIFKKIGKNEFEHIILFKETDLLRISGSLLLIGYHNKPILSNLISEVKVNKLYERTKQEENLLKIGLYISSIAYSNKDTAYKLIDLLINNIFMPTRIQKTKSPDEVNYFLTVISYLNISLACKAYAYAVAYSNPRIAYTLLGSVNQNPETKELDILGYVKGCSLWFDYHIKQSYDALGKVLPLAENAEIIFVPKGLK
jgi:hypothetical protein